MPEFATFDQRGYPTVSVREGYGAWQASYEDTVLDLMDVSLLDRLETVHWSETKAVADLGCGSGRTARWLASKGVTLMASPSSMASISPQRCWTEPGS